MLRVQEAVKQAKAYLPELFFDAVDKIEDIRLEEVELSEDEKSWAVTFSFVPANQPTPSLMSMLAATRRYKTIRIRSTDGQFIGVRNGMLAAA